jgi:hypothetical protein
MRFRTLLTSIVSVLLCISVLLSIQLARDPMMRVEAPKELSYPLESEHVSLLLASSVETITTTEAPTITVAPTTTSIEAPREVIPLVEAKPSHYSTAPCTTGEFFDPNACPIERYLGDFSAGEITALLQREFPDDPVWASKVAQCESHYLETGMRDNAGRWATNGNPDDGVMQLNRPTWGMWSPDGTHRVFKFRPEWDWDSMSHEVGPNLWMARIVYDRSGRGAWSCSRVVGMR